MSIVMVGGDRLGLMGEQPPTVITEAFYEHTGVWDAPLAAALTAPLAHLGFGAACGVGFGLLRRLAPRLPSVSLGVGFGMTIWVVSYKGWIPALGLLPPPEVDRPGRAPVMIAAHVVFGIALGRLMRSR